MVVLGFRFSEEADTQSCLCNPLSYLQLAMYGFLRFSSFAGPLRFEEALT